jgi:hypothetical protein
MKLAMAAAASANSADCISQGTCKPLGGYSVWAALPPIPATAETTAAVAAAAGGGGVGDDGRPIILVVAQMDSIDMFHDSVQVRQQQQQARWRWDIEAVCRIQRAYHFLHAQP